MEPHCIECHASIDNQQKRTSKIQKTLTDAVEQHSRPPFSEYLDLVSFVAVITISFSLSASQGYATSQSLFGVLLDANATERVPRRALSQTIHAATLLSWAAATSAFSLMIALVLRILSTWDIFTRLAKTPEKDGRTFCGKIPARAVMFGSWIALASQAASMLLIGQSLKTTSRGSGWMIQVDFTRLFHRKTTDD